MRDVEFFASGSRAAVLTRLEELGVLTSTETDALNDRNRPPGWLMAMQGLMAWFASLLIVGMIFIFTRDASGRLMWGVIFCVGAIGLFQHTTVFAVQMAFAFSFAGQAMLIWGLHGELGGEVLPPILAALAAGVMVLPPSNAMHRALCACWALVLIAFAPLTWRFDPLGAIWLESCSLLLSGLALVLWGTRACWAGERGSPYLRALADGALTASLWGVVMIGSPREVFRLELADSIPHMYAIGAASLTLASCALLARTAQARGIALAVALPFIVAIWPAPWLMLCASFALVSFHGGQRGWFGVVLLVTVLLLGAFYYTLDLDLMTKSGILATSGALLLLLRHGLLAWVRQDAEQAEQIGLADR
jgi:hypothetical protein